MTYPTLSAAIALEDAARVTDTTWTYWTRYEPVYSHDGADIVAAVPRRHPRRCSKAEHDALGLFHARCAANGDPA